MNVILVQLPHFFGAGQSRLPECYPLGLGYISSVLTQHKIDHAGLNLWEKQWPARQAAENFDFSDFDVIAIGAYSTQYQYLKEFSLLLKKRYPDKPILCGGPGPTFNADVILRRTGVDICVLGEGERTIIDLLGHLDNPGAVSGIAYKSGDAVTATSSREPIRDLDEIPLPNREMFDMKEVMRRKAVLSSGKNYLDIDKSGRRAADIIAGRGCPYLCRFCSRTFKGVRLRKIDSIVAEARQLQESYGVNFLQFNDELVLVGKTRSLELCSKLKGLGLSWACQGRIDQVDEELLKAMRDAGCVEVGYGVESVSQDILDSMKKGLRAEQIVPVIRMTKGIGITPIIQYMFGYPGENAETIKATERFFKEIDHPFVGFTTTPIPGSPLYQDCRDNGVIADEEDYLLRLDSGYNVHGALINLTGFSDREFALRKKLLQWKITHNYLARRPRQYAGYILEAVKRKGRALLKRLRASLRLG